MPVAKYKIASILGGISETAYVGKEGTFQTSIAMDPDFPISASATRTSGQLVPTVYAKFSGSDITAAAPSIITNSKDNNTYVVQTNGNFYLYKSALTTGTSLGTFAGGAASSGTYYNNYIYVFGTGAAKTDVSRWGPMNTLPYDGQSGNFTVGLTVTGITSGATGIIIADVDAGATGTLTLSNITGFFVDNETITDTSTGSAVVNRTLASLITDAYWTGTLSLTALTNTIYPTVAGVSYPNHVGFEHTDGALYFTDFKNGQGLIHKIKTSRTTNEGDTNNGSAYNVLDLNFGYYPTAITNYSTDIVIASQRTVDTTINQGVAALFFWDPTNTDSFYRQMPLRDPLCTALLNENGVLNVWTGNAVKGCRLSYYSGGDSTQELVFMEDGAPPLAGAVGALGSRIVWGSFTTYPSNTASVFSYGSKIAGLPKGLNNIIKTAAGTTTPIVTALKHVQQSSSVIPQVVVAWSDNSSKGLDKYSTSATYSSIWYGPMMPVNQKFSFQNLRVSLGGAVDSNTTLTPILHFDDDSSSVTLTAINNSNFPSSRKVLYKQPSLISCQGLNNFFLELQWTGTTMMSVLLPITLEIQLYEDEPLAS